MKSHLSKRTLAGLATAVAVVIVVLATPFAMGGQTLILSSARDITDRQRAEALLRASEARTRDIYAQASDGLYVIPRRQSLPRRQGARAGKDVNQL